MESDDVLLSKSAIIERCLNRIQEEYAKCPELDNFTHVDALTLNIERACQAAIDMANHIVAKKRLGVPRSSSHSFLLLAQHQIISADLAQSLGKMAGFRNIAVHSYQELDQAILSVVAEQGFNDFIYFCLALGIHINPKRY